MRRRSLLLSPLALAGCARMTFAPMPASVGPWVRDEVSSLGPDDAPPAMRALGVQKVLRTTYRREDSAISVEAFIFKSDASAFEARQKHAAPGTIAFHRGSVFVVCASKQAQPALLEFSGALETAWLRSAQ